MTELQCTCGARLEYSANYCGSCGASALAGVSTLQEDLVVVKAGANLGGIGGVLYLTKNTLSFVPHVFNRLVLNDPITTTRYDIPIVDIVSVGTFKILAFADKGMSIKTNNGETLEFTVNGRDRMLTMLQRLRSLPS